MIFRAAIFLHSLAQTTELVSNETAKADVVAYYQQLGEENRHRYDSYLYNEGTKSAVKVKEVKAIVPADAKTVNGYELLNAYFDTLFENNKTIFAFGEDVGKIGDVKPGLCRIAGKIWKASNF